MLSSRVLLEQVAMVCASFLRDARLPFIERSCFTIARAGRAGLDHRCGLRRVRAARWPCGFGADVAARGAGARDGARRAALLFSPMVLVVCNATPLARRNLELADQNRCRPK